MAHSKGTCSQEARPPLRDLNFAQTYRCKRCGLTSTDPNDLCEAQAEYQA